MLMNTLSLEKSPRAGSAGQPSFDEVAHYAHLILQHEGRPLSALPDCQREAELQLWAERSFRGASEKRAVRHST